MMKAASPYHFPDATALALDPPHLRMDSARRIDVAIVASCWALVTVTLHMHPVDWDSPLEASSLEQDFVLGSFLAAVGLLLVVPSPVPDFGLVGCIAVVVGLLLSSFRVRDSVDLRVWQDVIDDPPVDWKTWCLFPRFESDSSSPSWYVPDVELPRPTESAPHKLAVVCLVALPFSTGFRRSSKSVWPLPLRLELEWQLRGIDRLPYACWLVLTCRWRVLKI